MNGGVFGPCHFFVSIFVATGIGTGIGYILVDGKCVVILVRFVHQMLCGRTMPVVYYHGRGAVHTIIEYVGTPWDKEESALHDCREWLGDKFEQVMQNLEIAVEEGVSQKMIVNSLAIAGIRGYPAQVMAMRALELVNTRRETSHA